MTDGSPIATPPVLILAFNRPDTTARVVDSLRAVQPPRVFLAVDGARPDRPGEQAQVEQVQRLAERIDWACDVRTLFRPRNLGCKFAVSEAITWFFSEVESGIILEDDCVAHPSFFPYAAQLLERYRDDQRMHMISGDNFQFGRRRTAYSYYFSLYTHIWGWATWRRAWQLFDFEMKLWPELRAQGWLHDILGDAVAAQYWTRIFDDTHSGRNSSWAYRWTYSAWVNGGLTILPDRNLVSNIGFGDLATHTRRRGNRLAGLPAVEMDFPLAHPPYVIRDARADAYTQRTVFASPLWKRLAKPALRMLGRR